MRPEIAIPPKGGIEKDELILAILHFVADGQEFDRAALASELGKAAIDLSGMFRPFRLRHGYKDCPLLDGILSDLLLGGGITYRGSDLKTAVTPYMKGSYVRKLVAKFTPRQQQFFGEIACKISVPKAVTA